jgi:hypothetical protein
LRVLCWTTFDITITGVKNNFNINRLPFTDQAGRQIDAPAQWHHSRNQQRNWDTINQILSLRTLPHSITASERDDTGDVRIWRFEFSLDQEDALAEGSNIFGALERDCQGVPMITGLGETPAQTQTLEPGSNIGFQKIPHK